MESVRQVQPGKVMLCLRCYPLLTAVPASNTLEGFRPVRPLDQEQLELLDRNPSSFFMTNPQEKDPGYFGRYGVTVMCARKDNSHWFPAGAFIMEKNV